MVYQFTCATCMRYNGDIIYYHLKGYSIDEIIKLSDISKFGRLCCVLHVSTMTDKIAYHPSRTETES